MIDNAISCKLKKYETTRNYLFTISELLGYDFLKKFNLPSAKEQEAKIVLQIEIDKEKQGEVLKFIHDKDLYNLLLRK